MFRQWISNDVRDEIAINQVREMSAEVMPRINLDSQKLRVTITITFGKFIFLKTKKYIFLRLLIVISLLSCFPALGLGLVKNSNSFVGRYPCGQNCAYLFCRMKGSDVLFSEFENLLPSNEKTSLLDLKECISNYGGIPSVVVKKELSSISASHFPVIAHVRLNGKEIQDGHYVVLCSVTVDENVLTFIDGTSGKLNQVTVAWFEKRFTGFLIMSKYSPFGTRHVLVFGLSVCFFGGLLLLLRKSR